MLGRSIVRGARAILPLCSSGVEHKKRSRLRDRATGVVVRWRSLARARLTRGRVTPHGRPLGVSGRKRAQSSMAAAATMWLDALVLSERDVRMLERLAEAAKGSRAFISASGYFKGILLRGEFIRSADAALPDAREFLRAMEDVRARASELAGTPLHHFTVELSDRRSRTRGAWHLDTPRAGTWLNVVVPLDDIGEHNGRTLLRDESGAQRALHGRRGHAYAFRGCEEHSVEGNRDGAPRRLLLVVMRPSPHDRSADPSTGSYQRVLALDRGAGHGGGGARRARPTAVVRPPRPPTRRSPRLHPPAPGATAA